MGHRIDLLQSTSKSISINDTTCLQGWALIGQEHPWQLSYSGIELGRNEIDRYWRTHSQESLRVREREKERKKESEGEEGEEGETGRDRDVN